MSLRKKKGYWFGDDLRDLRSEMERYADANGYALSASYEPSACPCGERSTLYLFVDDVEGGASIACGACHEVRFVADSQVYMDDTQECFCICDQNDFQVLVGAAFYADSQDVRWWYVGCRCVHCSCVAVYADWKDDGTPWESTLRVRV